MYPYFRGGGGKEEPVKETEKELPVRWEEYEESAVTSKSSKETEQKNSE